VDKDARVTVISNTPGMGAAQIDMPRDLGELRRPNRVLVTPDRPEATPIRDPEPERSPGVMMSWLRVFPRPSGTVSLCTTRASA
jgi:hypothetical protein